MDDPLRGHLARLLEGGDAHATFETAVQGLPAELRGVRPAGFAHSAWELLEHLRLAQADILDFCRNSDYRELQWPDDYWPASPAPAEGGWDGSVAGYRADRDALKQLAEDPALDLFAAIPHGTGQTYLREILLAADHNAYHLGQLVAVRRALGAWPGA